MASSKRQTTMAKIAREQAVKERRARKQQKADERKRAAAELGPSAESTLSAHSAPTEAEDDSRTALT